MLSRLETEPPGATVFVDGSFVGITPTSTYLPAKSSVHVRLELAGHQTIDTMLDRRVGVPAGAPPGTGWEAVYYWPLVRR
ncbi:MAG: PEGA domain-containing protein [Planctomycetes bacterium]|nr:PEGA domain-containing protein [Planctomycetota bacterium]